MSMLLFLSGLVLGNLVEWVAHRYILHGLGKRPKSFFHHHWEHHRACRKGMQNHDASYLSWRKSLLSKETLGLCLLAGAFLPLAWVLPSLYAGLLCQMVLYFLVHRFIHVHPSVGGLLFPWHDDHHCGNQNANWCVTYPLWDWVFKTRRRS